MSVKGIVLYPKRKGQRLEEIAGDEINTVINEIIQTTIQNSSFQLGIVFSGTLDDVPDGTSYERVAAAELASGIYKSASAIVSGIIEVATVAETNTGTDVARAVSPDGLAGSNLGTKAIGIIAIERATDVTVGDGKVDIPIPAALNGMNLIRAQAMVITAGTTGATTVAVYNDTSNQEMLSTNISIASGATVGTVGTINTTYDDVATNDVLRIDVDAVSTTAPKGLLVVLEFQLP